MPRPAQEFACTAHRNRPPSAEPSGLFAALQPEATTDGRLPAPGAKSSPERSRATVAWRRRPCRLRLVHLLALSAFPQASTREVSVSNEFLATISSLSPHNPRTQTNRAAQFD